MTKFLTPFKNYKRKIIQNAWTRFVEHVVIAICGNWGGARTTKQSYPQSISYCRRILRPICVQKFQIYLPQINIDRRRELPRRTQNFTFAFPSVSILQTSWWNEYPTVSQWRAQKKRRKWKHISQRMKKKAFIKINVAVAVAV